VDAKGSEHLVLVKAFSVHKVGGLHQLVIKSHHSDQLQVTIFPSQCYDLYQSSH
jgi:hypothetical protein